MGSPNGAAPGGGQSPRDHEAADAEDRQRTTQLACPSIPWEVAVAERLARECYDGHLTILRFTTGWKAVFGTPDMSRGGRSHLSMVDTAPSLEAACLDLLLREAS